MTLRRIGIVSDTHGLVRPELIALFEGVDHILHAGDIGGDHVLDALRRIAPVTSVDGNNDGTATGEEIVRTEVAGLRVLLTHILPRPHRPDQRVLASLRTTPADLVVFGHSHLPHHETRSGALWFNPASAGPRRFDYPVAAGILEIDESGWRAYHVALDQRSVEALHRTMNRLSAG